MHYTIIKFPLLAHGTMAHFKYKFIPVYIRHTLILYDVIMKGYVLVLWNTAYNVYNLTKPAYSWDRYINNERIICLFNFVFIVKLFTMWQTLFIIQHNFSFKYISPNFFKNINLLEFVWELSDFTRQDHCYFLFNQDTNFNS